MTGLTHFLFLLGFFATSRVFCSELMYVPKFPFVKYTKDNCVNSCYLLYGPTLSKVLCQSTGCNAQDENIRLSCPPPWKQSFDSAQNLECLVNTTYVAKYFDGICSDFVAELAESADISQGEDSSDNGQGGGRGRGRGQGQGGGRGRGRGRGNNPNGNPLREIPLDGFEGDPSQGDPSQRQRLLHFADFFVINGRDCAIKCVLEFSSPWSQFYCKPLNSTCTSTMSKLRLVCPFDTPLDHGGLANMQYDICKIPSSTLCAMRSIDVTRHDLILPDAKEGFGFEGICKIRLKRSQMTDGVSVQWLLNSNALLNTTRIQIKTKTVTDPNANGINIDSKLLIYPLKVTDSGLLQCKLMYDGDVISTSSKVLRVLGRPEVTMTPKDAIVGLNGTAVVLCDARVPMTGHSMEGKPVDFIWHRNGLEIVPLNSSATIETVSNTTSKLTARQLTQDVQFTCRGRNGAGFGDNDTVKVTVLQVKELFCESETNAGILWPKTSVGQTVTASCPSQTALGHVKRCCGLKSRVEAKWTETSFSDCVDKEFQDIINDLESLGDTIEPGEQGQVENIANRLENMTNENTIPNAGLEPGNLKASLSSVVRLATLRKASPSVDVSNLEFKSVIGATSNLLSRKNHKSWGAVIQDDSRASVRIMENIDIYSNVKAKTINYNESFSLLSNNIVLELKDVPKESTADISFPNIPQEGDIDWIDSSTDKIFFKKEVIDQILSSSGLNTLTFSNIVYKTLNTILPTESESFEVNSKVMSLSVENLFSTPTLDPPIELRFKVLNKSHQFTNDSCVYWDFPANQWSSEGCTLVEQNEGSALCQCNHLTNFGLIMSPSPATGIHAEILGVISIIGCSISVIGMIATIVIFAIIWKSVKSHNLVILMNLCVALIIANVMFLSGVNQTENQAACTAIAAMLHYFYLASFFIMLAEGATLLMYIIFVFHVRTNKEIVLLLAAAWGLPAVVVGISLAVTKLEGYGNENFCWLSVETGLLWAFVGPALCIILVNVVILVIVIHRIARSSMLTSKTENAEKDKIKSSVWNVMVLTPLLGLTWIFGVFSVNEHTLVFQYIFAICNSLQGLFIFLFHIAFNAKVRGLILDACNCSKGFSRCSTSLPLLNKGGKYNVTSSGKTPTTSSTSDRLKGTSTDSANSSPMIKKVNKPKGKVELQEKTINSDTHTDTNTDTNTDS